MNATVTGADVRAPLHRNVAAAPASAEVLQ
ncbi:hypothetical protein IGB42_00370 [Andreprevotia sp. IGB-42]|nr:hypothetical protein IGB42_00370 [Andreprevotia sp. IGB-42]